MGEPQRMCFWMGQSYGFEVQLSIVDFTTVY